MNVLLTCAGRRTHLVRFFKAALAGCGEHPVDSAPRAVRQGPPPIRSTQAKVGRNDPCPCGSGKKYKQCCLNK